MEQVASLVGERLKISVNSSCGALHSFKYSGFRNVNLIINYFQDPALPTLTYDAEYYCI